MGGRRAGLAGWAGLPGRQSPADPADHADRKPTPTRPMASPTHGLYHRQPEDRQQTGSRPAARRPQAGRQAYSRPSRPQRSVYSSEFIRSARTLAIASIIPLANSFPIFICIPSSGKLSAADDLLSRTPRT